MKKWIIVILILGIIILVVSLNSSKQIMSINIYNENQELVKKTLDIVNTIPSTFFIDLTVKAYNDGQLPLVCNLNKLSPTQLDISMPRTEKIIFPGKSQEWTSNLISMKDLTGNQRFSVEVVCYSTSGEIKTYLNNSAYVDLTITSSCGDGNCNSNEDEISCPIDCFFGDKSVKFRTLSNYLYFGGDVDEIAFSESCSGNLTKAGEYSGISGTLQGNPINCNSLSNQYNKVFDLNKIKLIDSKWNNIPDATYGFSLWKKISPIDIYVVCGQVNSTTAIYYGFSTTRTPTTQISDSPIVLDISKEEVC